jgi:hypothetical protein
MFLPITYFKYVFHVKIQLFMSLQPDRIRIRIGLAPWIRIRIEIKSWIRNRVRIEANANPQHWFVFCLLQL